MSGETTRWYGQFFTSAFTKQVDLVDDVIKVALFGSGLTPDQDAHQYFNAAPYTTTGNEISGSGYTPGGKVLTGVSLAYNGSTNVLAFDANDVAWNGASFDDALYAVIYDSTPANQPLLFYVGFGEAKSPDNGTLSISWDPAGLGYVTVA